MAGVLAERKKTFLDDFKRRFGEYELQKLSKEETKLAVRLDTPSFTEKAPPDIVEKARSQLEELRFQQRSLQERLHKLSS